MPDYSVTVRNEDTGETAHLSGIYASDHYDAVYRADSAAGSPNWETGSAPITFYQLDPELDTFSFGYYSSLADAQADGLHHYAEHMRIMNSPVGQLAYMQYPVSADDPFTHTESWHITDSLHPLRNVTMCQIVKCDLWTSRQTSSPEPCIHPGVFAADRPAEHCDSCGRDVPRSEL